MKLFLSLFLCFSSTLFAQYTLETVSFVDTTTSALIDAPSRGSYYLAGIAKPDSGGNILTFEVEAFEDSTDSYDLLTSAGTAAYSITLPDSTNAYSLTLPEAIFKPWRYFRIKFAKKTTCDITIMWRKL